MYAAICAVVLLASDLAMAAAWGIEQTAQVPTYHLDGAFQTASGLLRLQAGDLPGRDFLPYLGIGPVFLLFPLFKATGGTLASSGFSAWSITALFLSLSAGTILTLALRLRSLIAPLTAAGVVLVVLLAGPDAFVWLPRRAESWLEPLFQMGVPGNSLRPIRAAAPTLLIAATVVALFRLPRRRALILIGAIFGATIACWSNDYALAPTAVVLAFVVHHGIRVRRWRWRELLTLSVALVGALVLTALVTTGGYYLNYALYNFRDVLGDQSWYFGGWGPQSRVRTTGDLFRFIGVYGAIPGLILLSGLMVLVLLRPTLRWTCIAALGAATFVGGLVAILGGHADDYFLPFRAWTVLSTIGVLLAAGRLATRSLSRTHGLLPLRSAVMGGLALVLATAAVVDVSSAAATRTRAARASGATWIAELGGPLPGTFAPYLAAAPPNGRFVEEYAGLWTALRGPNQRQKVDAVIHGLGQERARLVSSLTDARTEFAVTTSPQLSTQWVSWGVSANWSFYRELFLHFSPESSSPSTIVWRRTEGSVAQRSGVCTVAADGQSVAVTPAAAGLNELRVTYKGPGRGSRTFSMLENDIDYADDADGFVALDPGAASQTVPIYRADRNTTTYRLRDLADSIQTTIVGCAVRTMPPLPHNSTANLYKAVLTRAS